MLPDKLEKLIDALRTEASISSVEDSTLLNAAAEAFVDQQAEIEQLTSSIIDYVNRENNRQVAFSQVMKFVEVIKKYPSIDIDIVDKDNAYKALSSALLCDYKQQIADQQAIIDKLVALCEDCMGYIDIENLTMQTKYKEWNDILAACEKAKEK